MGDHRAVGGDGRDHAEVRGVPWVEGREGLVVDAAAKPVVDIDDDLEGVVAMGVGDAIGKEDGRDAIPQVEVRPEGAIGGSHDHNIQLF